MDIVYFVKDSKENEELRYSLRSVEKNLKNVGEVWTIGGSPEGIIPDHHIDFDQTGDKHDNVMNMRRAFFESNETPDEFLLFNDDFFIMKKVSKVKTYISGTLESRVKSIARRYGTITKYARRLERTAKELKRRDFDTLCYEMHIPMMIDKAKALEVINKFNDQLAFRSCYGNYWSIGGEIRDDCKVKGVTTEPDKSSEYLSTMDKSFNSGKIGEYIREKFPNKCKWEQ